MERESKKQMSAGVVLSYLVIIVQFVTGLVYTPIVLRSLGKSQYGIYSLCTSFMGYLTIMNSGINAAYVRFYVQTKVQDQKKIPGLNGMFLKIFIILAFITLFGGWCVGIFSPQIFGDKISPDEYVLVKQCFFFLSINSFVNVINCVFSSIITANEKFIFAKTITLIMTVAKPIFTIPFLLRGYDCVIVIIINMCVSIVTVIVNALFCIRVFHTRFYLKERDMVLLRDIIQFSGFIVFQSIMDQLNWQIDKFILARTHGTEEISIYSVGATFNTYYMTFSSALSGVFIAQINKLQAQNLNEKLNNLFLKTSRIFSYLILLVMTAFIIFGHQFIIRWAGEEYSKSYFIGILLMLPITLSLCMGLGQDIARAKNKHQLQIVINFFVSIINAIISIPLAITWGSVGSATGTFIASIIICIIIQPIYYHRIIGLDMHSFFTELFIFLPGLIPSFILGFIINHFHLLRPIYTNIMIWGLIFLVIYAISMWFIVMNNQEKEIVKKIISKVL